VIGWFLVAQPQISAAGAADQQRVEAAAAVAASQAVVAQLKADSANMPQLQDELDDLRTSIPAGVDPSGYIDGLSALATVSGVAITSLTVADPFAYSPATPPTDPNAVVADGTEGDAATDGAAVPPPAPVNPSIVTNPLVDSSNFVAIPVTIEVTGNGSTILTFVNGLQSNDRLFLVTTLATEPGADPSQPSLVGKIGGYIYAIPTGVVGDPRPISTIVKHMEAATPPPTETPTPDPTETTAP
jgi:Tfp pilus assembly protein PilO